MSQQARVVFFLLNFAVF